MESHKLTEAMVRALVPARVSGVYTLGRYADAQPVVVYVGRSDLDLRRRLLSHARAGEFDWFSFTVTRSIFEAFRLECCGWHLYSSICNMIHPDAPARLPYRCPYCIAGREIAEGLAGRNRDVSNLT